MHAHLYPIHYVFWSEHRKKRTLFKSKIDDWVAGSVDFDIMNKAKSHYFALFAPEKRAENLLFSPESVQWKFAMPSFFSHFVENATFCCSRASCAHFDQTIEIKLEYFCYFSLNCTSIDFEWKKNRFTFTFYVQSFICIYNSYRDPRAAFFYSHHKRLYWWRQRRLSFFFAKCNNIQLHRLCIFNKKKMRKISLNPKRSWN